MIKTNLAELLANYAVRCQIECKIRELLEQKSMVEICLANYQQMEAELTEQLIKATGFENWTQVEEYFETDLNVHQRE